MAATAPAAATPAPSGSDDKAFTKAVNNRKCDCGRGACMTTLKKYYLDPASVYPGDKVQLFFYLSNPRVKNPGSRHTKQRVLTQQAFDRALALLKPSNVEKPEDIEELKIAIVHFHPDVIRRYNNDHERGTAKFAQYLLPSDAVGNNKLGTKFTDLDRFRCIGSNVQDNQCWKEEKRKMKEAVCPLDYLPSPRCLCNRYLNAPFVTTDAAQFSININSAGSDRSQRAASYSDSRKKEMSEQEIAVQSQRAEKMKAAAAEKQQELDDLRSHTANMNTKLQREEENKNVDLRRQLQALQEEQRELKRKYAVAMGEKLVAEEKTEKYKGMYEETNKKLKAAEERERYQSSRSAVDINFSIDKLSKGQIVRLGLSRRSMLDVQWHGQFGTAARSLYNFKSFDEMLTYIWVLFPSLRNDIRNLKQKGVAKFISGKYLTQLEQCIICRASSKVGVTNEQLGFIWGVTKSAIGKIRQKWMPRWGMGGRVLTDLQLYEDYVKNERPDEYEENGLGDCGCQCDGKDFMTECIRKNSALHRAQHSSKVHHSALRCITWSSLCGLVWAVTPLVLARATENALVQWFGHFEREEDMYVPIRRSDWSDEGVASVEEESGDLAIEVVGFPSMEDAELGEDEELVVVSVQEEEESDEAAQVLMSDDIYEEDSHLRECRDDMSVGGSSEEEDDDASKTNDNVISLDAEVDQFLKDLDADINETNADEKKPLATEDIIRSAEIDEMAKASLNAGPDRNGKALLEQQLMLQELHVLYEDKVLSKCLLSMYLKLTEKHRLTLIKDLEDYRDGKLATPPKVPRRLAKLAKKLKVLADRGFDGDNLSYPHFNTVITPSFLDSEKKQFTMGELERDRRICELRYTCEVVFSRVTTEKILSGVIPYKLLRYIEDAFYWGHAQANLRLPLKMPGSWSGIDESYFGISDSEAIDSEDSDSED